MFISQNKNNNHSFFMRLALDQAHRNLGNTKTNPSVGCVITKNNSVISVGCTSINGRPHAEDNAINFSKNNLKNSDLYVTLEPCSHYGKTSPCTSTIIKSKIKKVFFSITDPDHRSFNRSTKLFKKRKVKVSRGICSKESELFYRSYIKYKNELLPFVTCKMAISSDFFTINKEKKSITNKFSRSRVHLMRSNHDCIITSSKTIIKDNSELTCRINGLKNRSPVRILLDNNLKIPLNSKVFKEAKKYRTIVFYNKLNKKKINQLNRLKINSYMIDLDNSKNLNLEKVLYKTKLLGFQRVFVEAGMNLSINFLKKNLVDDFNLFISNRSLKNNGMGNIKNKLKILLKNKKKIKEKVNLFGDKLITYKIK